MTKEVKKGNKTYYACEICKFAYEDIEWAEECQDWCKEHHSCNMEITRHAIEL